VTCPGRRFSRSTLSVAPSSGSFFSAQATKSSTAFSMCPFFSQSGSNDGDLFGMAMYSAKVGTISSRQISSVNVRNCA
jgi:hypothetical protein